MKVKKNKQKNYIEKFSKSWKCVLRFNKKTDYNKGKVCKSGY